jgi:16S rRNA (guanine966-N2)-methyltransferase
MLGDVTGARVLDLYAGSGALGIEALSRGAQHATFVESARPALAVLRDNLSRLDLGTLSTVVPASVFRAAKLLGAEAPFDLIFCDPPWADLPEVLPELALILKPELLAPGFRLLVEHPSRAPADFGDRRPDLHLSERRNWGDTAVSIFVAAARQPSEKNRK